MRHSRFSQAACEAKVCRKTAGEAGQICVSVTPINNNDNGVQRRRLQPSGREGGLFPDASRSDPRVDNHGAKDICMSEAKLRDGDMCRMYRPQKGPVVS